MSPNLDPSSPPAAPQPRPGAGPSDGDGRLARFAGQLRGSGLRVTQPRLAVLEVLSEGGHFDVDEVTTRVRARLKSVSTQAVYDVLGALARTGLARRIEPAGSPARYEGRTGDNHHHVVCRSCGTIGDVDCVVGEAPCLQPSARDGFVIDEAEVTFWGLCATCQTLPPPSS